MRQLLVRRASVVCSSCVRLIPAAYLPNDGGFGLYLPKEAHIQKLSKPGSNRLPALDGLRGLAILAVFACHYGDNFLSRDGHHTILWFGWFGVDLFFVLSGFLITGILVDALERPRFFHNFYIRRTLRIFPLFYILWIVLLLLTPFLHVEWNRYVFAQMFYFGNLTLTGASLGQHPDPGILMVGGHPLIFGHYWTLCLEEQFYLVWPLVVFLVRSRVVLLRIAVGLSAGILALRCVLTAVGSQIPLYNTPYTRVDSLLIGAALILWLRGREPGYIAPPRLYLPLALIPGIVLGVLLASIGRHWAIETSNPIFGTVGFTLLALSSAGFILASLDRASPLYRLFTWPGFMAVGTVSYGFYVFHAIPLRVVLEWFEKLPPTSHTIARFAVPVVTFAFFYLLSKLSYRFVEMPFLRLKDRLTPSGTVIRQNAVDAPPPQPLHIG